MQGVPHAPYQAAQSAAVAAAAAAQMASVHLTQKGDRPHTLQGDLDAASVGLHMPPSMFGPAYFDASGAACIPAIQDDFAASHDRSGEGGDGEEVVPPLLPILSAAF